MLKKMEDPSVGDGRDLPTLPDDVHPEIVLRLPAPSLCRARAVCKSWRDLTSEPSFLRAHAAGHAAAPPLLLTWWDKLTDGPNTTHCTVHLSIDRERRRRTGHRPAAAGGDERRSRSCCDLRIVLAARYSSTSGGAMRSWDGILCVEMLVLPRPPAFVPAHVPSSYLLLNPISTACAAVVPAPAVRGGPSDRGFIAGAYSHPVTDVFHFLHCTGTGSFPAGAGGKQTTTTTTPRFRVLTVDAPGATWRDVPVSGDADTAGLQAAVGRLRLQSSATAHGRLHWRVARSDTKCRQQGEEELLVFHAGREEFGRVALPRLHHDAAAIRQRAISTPGGKLCLLAGIAESKAAVEVWVLEDYDVGDWRRRQVIHVAEDSPLHGERALGNVGVLAGGDGVEEIVFYDCDEEEVCNERAGAGSWLGSRPAGSFGHGRGQAVHEQSLLPHDVIFGRMPRVPKNGEQTLLDASVILCSLPLRLLPG